MLRASSRNILGSNGVEMKTITKVVVGSRLHGLATETSDWDYRAIHMYSLKETLSPFRTLKNTDWIEGDQDNTSYELAQFCKSATKGNATILEVFFSDQVIETSPIAEEMRANWKKFMDTDQFVMASRGYAANQLNKMALFDDIGIKGQSRTPKFAIAYCRVLWQCSEFLKTGQFKCEMFWYDSEGTLWHDDGINTPTMTLDRLQNAMASHFEDEGMEEYVELVS